MANTPIRRCAIYTRKSSEEGLHVPVYHSPNADADFHRGLHAPDGQIYLVMRLYWPKTTPPSILPRHVETAGGEERSAEPTQVQKNSWLPGISPHQRRLPSRLEWKPKNGFRSACECIACG
jgi:hypothetical protein